MTGGMKEEVALLRNGFRRQLMQPVRSSQPMSPTLSCSRALAVFGSVRSFLMRLLRLQSFEVLNGWAYRNKSPIRYVLVYQKTHYCVGSVGTSTLSRSWVIRFTESAASTSSRTAKTGKATCWTSSGVTKSRPARCAVA